MSPERWHQIEEVYHSALERAPDQRAAFLVQVCGDDDELRREVESLLRHGDSQEALVDRPAWEAAGELLDTHTIDQTRELAGHHISHYEILEKLGEGGMGVVYKARDSHLKRSVALKVLPPEKVADPGRKKRFVQEARAASALNHPNIVTIYDIDRAEGVDFIAMEYVEGKTLDELIGRKGLKLNEALKYAVQIADALAKAHTAGIIHRDLKPSNVMVTADGRAKVLDFGLAKLTEAAALGADDSTITEQSSTQSGLIVGTVSYMSPEQAEGKKVDARSDIFSFGSVLYEMLTGRRAFRQDSRALTLAAIVHMEPPPLQAEIPPELERVIAGCLCKDPARRLQNAADVKLLLEWLERDAQAGGLGTVKPVLRLRSRKRRVALTLAVVSAGVVIAVGAYWAWSAPQAARAPAEVASITSDLGLTCGPAPSPKGDLLAYASDRSGDGNLDIWVQQLAGGGPVRRTHESTDELSPHFSPDGSKIVFERAGAGIFVMPSIGEGRESQVAAEGFSPRFSPDGKQIAFWTGDQDNRALGGAVYVVPFGGGRRTRLAATFADARFPLWAPDGQYVLFQGARSPEDEPEWWVAPTDGRPVVNTGILAVLRKGGLEPQPGPGDWRRNDIVFSATAKGGTHIWRVAMQVPDWKVVGSAEQLTFGTGYEGEPSIAPDGRIAFSSWFYRNNLWRLALGDGKPGSASMDRLSQTGAIDTHPSISADGKTLTFLARRSDLRQVWIHDLERGGESELTIGPGDKSSPVVSADGSRVAYSVTENGRPSIYTVPARSSQPGVANRACENCDSPSDWTRDGGKILYLSGRPRSVYLLDLASGASAPILSHPAYDLDQPRFSPDGHWIAFVAEIVPDRSRVFVAPFHPGAATRPDDWVAVTEGTARDDKPRWLDAGQLVFYSNRDHFGCLWKQRLQPGTKRPIGSPSSVHHFHALRLSPRTLYRNDFEIATARNVLVLNLVEASGNLWLRAAPERR